MKPDFGLIHNHHERAVYEEIGQRAAEHPHLARNDDLMGDVACVALNRLPPRYIRHSVDLAFFTTERERANTAREVAESVDFAFGYVQARHAMAARR